MAKELGNAAVLCDVDSRGVVTVTLNRPDVNNAYNEDMIQGLHQALDLVPSLPNARCGGAGQWQTFSGGGRSCLDIECCAKKPRRK
ncbi:MAG: enoyl-CoA hydratase/isomerase family protein [Zwartia sp.]